MGRYYSFIGALYCTRILIYNILSTFVNDNPKKSSCSTQFQILDECVTKTEFGVRGGRRELDRSVAYYFAVNGAAGSAVNGCENVHTVYVCIVLVWYQTCMSVELLNKW